MTAKLYIISHREIVNKNFKIKVLIVQITWSRIVPDNLPTSPATLAIGLEVKEDFVAPAGDLVRQGGATGLPHQGCPVTVSDLQVIKTTRGMRLDVEGSEF